jgi:hypothetical protein
MDNERLATSYLYNGRIPGWLEQCGNVKLSSAVKDIIVNRYPADQRAGLMASVYVMEPTYPYVDLRGNKCDDIHSVAISILSYMEEYAFALRNPNDNVFLYVEAHTKADVARLRSYFSPDSKLTQRVAILRLVYEIDPEIPFLVKYPSGNVQDIVHSFGYEDCSEDEWVSLSDGRLLSWMYSHEDLMACEALRIMTEGKEPTRSLGYKVLYNLDREAAYDLRDADNPYKVGEIMRDELKTWQDLTPEEFEEQVGEFADPNGRFYYFAQLHGWYEQLAQAKACFDLKSEENKERLGAYDLRTAAYRFCRYLGAIPTYLLEDGTELNDGTNFEKQTRRPILLGAMRRGALSQWMSVFFHEDPHKNFEEPYSYERRLEEWVMNLGEVDQNQPFYKRLVTAKEETTRKYTNVKKEYSRAKRKEHRWRTTFYSLCGLWIALLVVFGIDNRADVMSHTSMTILLPVGGVSAIIVGMRAFFRGYGFVLSALWGVLGLLSAMVPIVTMKYVYNQHPGMFIPTAIILTLIYMLICHLTDYHRDSKMENQFISEVMEDDVKTSLMEPLVYTFKQKSFKFKGSKFAMLDDVTNQVRSISGESVLHYKVWTMMAVLMLAEMILFNPKLMNYKIPEKNKISLSPNKVLEQLQKDVE